MTPLSLMTFSLISNKCPNFPINRRFILLISSMSSSILGPVTKHICAAFNKSSLTHSHAIIFDISRTASPSILLLTRRKKLVQVLFLLDHLQRANYILISVGELFRLVAANACCVTVIKNKSVVRVAIDKIYNIGFPCCCC